MPVSSIDADPAAEPPIRHAEAALCRVLSDETRLGMLAALAAGPLSVTELCRRLDLPQSTASRHLKVLRDQALVVATRDAQRVLYRLRDHHLLKVIAALDRYLVWTGSGGQGAAT